MKANELMVGDWVEVPFFEGKPKIVKVEEILSNEINPEWDGMENYGGIKIKYVKPIPLTPEILEKNGFEWHNNEAKYFPNTWCCGELMLEPIVNGTLFLIVSRNNYDDEVTNYTPFTIKFVHELQHAIRLCGKEKEIEL